jgi:uncharacterized protein YjiS (DUF1127 family)
MSLNEMNHNRRPANDLASLLGEALIAPIAAWGALGRPISAAVARLGAVFGRMERRHETETALSNLDEATLKDIGVQRHDIRRLAEITARAGNDNTRAAA